VPEVAQEDAVVRVREAVFNGQEDVVVQAVWTPFLESFLAQKCLTKLEEPVLLISESEEVVQRLQAPE